MKTPMAAKKAAAKSTNRHEEQRRAAPVGVYAVPDQEPLL